MLHPRIRIPLWAAVALPAAAYAVRAAMRGWDFRPDLPIDTLVFGGLAVLITLVALARRMFDGEDDQLAEDMHDEGHSSGDQR